MDAHSPLTCLSIALTHFQILLEGHIEGIHTKASLHMNDIIVFWSGPWSVCRLISVCDQFKLASGARVNRRKREIWPHLSSIPVTVGSDWLTVLDIWFEGAEAFNKNWLAWTGKIKQKLGLQGRALSMIGQNRVISYEVLSWVKDIILFAQNLFAFKYNVMPVIF